MLEIEKVKTCLTFLEGTCCSDRLLQGGNSNAKENATLKETMWLAVKGKVFKSLDGKQAAP